MAEIEYKGIKVGGSKLLLILPLLGTLIGGLWGGFEVYQRYISMEKKINSFVAPDLSEFDKSIALIESQTKSELQLITQQINGMKSELDMILEEITLVANTAKELKDDLKGDVRQLQLDKRHLEDIVDSVKNKTREELRLFEQSIKDLESDLDLKINKALNNPLNAISN
jgi:DNA repair exonuclease SbcCD ATPase subunit